MALWPISVRSRVREPTRLQRRDSGPIQNFDDLVDELLLTWRKLAGPCFLCKRASHPFMDRGGAKRSELLDDSTKLASPQQHRVCTRGRRQSRRPCGACYRGLRTRNRAERQPVEHEGARRRAAKANEPGRPLASPIPFLLGTMGCRPGNVSRCGRDDVAGQRIRRDHVGRGISRTVPRSSTAFTRAS